MLDPNVKQNLLKAVDLAVGPGECRYVIDDKPACVVAQYMHLNGVPVEEMKKWGKWFVSHELLRSVPCYGAPRTLLQDLQHVWDGREDKDQMRALIEEADRA